MCTAQILPNKSCKQIQDLYDQYDADDLYDLDYLYDQIVMCPTRGKIILKPLRPPMGAEWEMLKPQLDTFSNCSSNGLMPNTTHRTPL